MRLLVAAAELAPVARVGGLAEAVGGLVGELRSSGVAVDVALPDYGNVTLEEEEVIELSVPNWAGPAQVRSGAHPEAGRLSLIGTPLTARPHPYVDSSGETWPDNDVRFMAFSAGVAALADRSRPDVLHLNDWHTAAATAFLKRRVSTVLTIHTLGYQGVMGAEWLSRIPGEMEPFRWFGGVNPLAGGIQLADLVTTVSPNYAQEIRRADQGMGLDRLLRSRGDSLVGIRNGIDVAEWNPAGDGLIAANYEANDLSGREICRAALVDEVGWEDPKEPIIGVVSRLFHQKGIDILLEASEFLAELPGRLIVLGSGEQDLAAALADAASARPERIWFYDGYDVSLAHRIFAGADLFAMPSRFEPCGLAQMQAMAYGAIPIVTPVGGLVDTVRDADEHKDGTGIVARGLTSADLIDALHRGIRALRPARRRRAIQRRGMTSDWSWKTPAAHYLSLYEGLTTS
jgi:starch synthase